MQLVNAKGLFESGWKLAAALFLLSFAPQVSANTAAADANNVRVVMELPSPLEPGEFAWDTEGATTGPLWIVVDLEVARIYVYRGGVEIGRAAVNLGTDRKPTPTGTFPILQKKVDHTSNIYVGAPMPYMMRLTWTGIAIHGSNVDPGAVTRGCVGVPVDFAEKLYPLAGLGTKVTVTRNWMPHIYRRA